MMMNNECEVLNRLKKADDLIMTIADVLQLSILREYPTKESFAKAFHELDEEDIIESNYDLFNRLQDVKRGILKYKRGE